MTHCVMWALSSAGFWVGPAGLGVHWHEPGRLKRNNEWNIYYLPSFQARVGMLHSPPPVMVPVAKSLFHSFKLYQISETSNLPGLFRSQVVMASQAPSASPPIVGFLNSTSNSIVKLSPTPFLESCLFPDGTLTSPTSTD